MITLTHRTAKSARRHRAVAALLGVLAIFGAGVAVYATASTPPFALTPSPTTETINSGSSASYIITIVPQSGFTSAVTLTAGSLPRGTSSSWTVGSTTTSGASVTVPAGSGTRTARLSVGGGQPNTGSNTISVTGTSTGGSNSTSVQLVIVKQNAANFTLALNPSALTPVAGSASITSTITITRTDFSGAVTLGPVSGIPAGSGIAATVTPTSTMGSTAQLSVTTTPWVTQPGTYTLVLPGTGMLSGKSSSTNSVAFTLSVPSPGSFPISGGLTSALTLGTAGSQKLNLSITNPYGTPLTLDDIVVTVASITQATHATGTCNQAGANSPNFRIGNLPATYSVTVPANSTKTLSVLGTGQEPTVTWIDQNWAQNGCLGAALNFSYAAQGQY